jgi:hypothetical protein
MVVFLLQIGDTPWTTTGSTCSCPSSRSSRSSTARRTRRSPGLRLHDRAADARRHRRGHDLLEQQGAGNVAWFWSVNRVDNQKDPSVAKYYPGDAIQYSAEMTAAFGAGVADPRYGNGAPPVG